MKHLALTLSALLAALAFAQNPKETLATTADNALTNRESQQGWKLLFNGSDLSNWTDTAGWSVKDGALHTSGRGSGLIYTVDQFQDFELKVDFKMSKGANSGVFIRLWDKPDWLNTGIEVQILDTADKQTMGKHDCGAIYDIQAPLANAAKPAGEWNTYHIIAKGQRIAVILNGHMVNQIDLNKWTEPGKNPDGTANKFKYAYKEMTKKGWIALQNHGNEVWFKNIKVKPL